MATATSARICVILTATRAISFIAETSGCKAERLDIPGETQMLVSQLALVYGTYLIATASPGPSNMAIMATAMRHGRVPALALAAGVITGSLFWATLAATGISAVLAASAQALFIIKVVGGVYLLSLAWKRAV
ncbi:hypothetical protein G6F31_019900 [Rhizopus arrhizus]|nr:hypothetical protein G6F31_019900 [Rhizopus arrhizus]